MAKVFQVKDFNLYYGDHRALIDINMDIDEKGHIVGLF